MAHCHEPHRPNEDSYTQIFSREDKAEEVGDQRADERVNPITGKDPLHQ
jgi:hypothetical protein